MTLGIRLRDARKQCGYTQKQLAEKIGAKHNSISNWENGLNMPDPTTIENLCSTLMITPNYLLLGDELSTVSRRHISAAELGLLNKYRRLDNKSQGAVNSLIDYYCNAFSEKSEASTDFQEENDRVIAINAIREPLPQKAEFSIMKGLISSQSVAAGTGTYLDKDSFDSIVVEKNDLTRKAAFYVPVSGNSMEPKFHDGDILIIEQTQVSPGEIGIFTLDGSGFVKIRGNGELISINPDYPPIPMNDDIICNGKVIGMLQPEWIVE